MVSPVADYYGCTSGGVIAGGRFLLPAWLRSTDVGAWATISGTTAPSDLNDFCGMAWRETEGVIEGASLASGGHGGDLTGNAVQTIRLDVDSPEWVTRRGNSDATGWSTTGSTGAYFPSDGRPVPRHTYWYNWWVPELHRYMMFGCRFAGSGAYDYQTVDGFSPVLNDWDESGTYANLGTGYQPTVRDPESGLLYGTSNGLTTFDPSTQQWSQQAMSGSGGVNRGGSAFDTARNQLYHLSAGDNWATPSSTIASTVISTSGVKTPISFNSSAAWTQFQARASGFLNSTLDYDPDLDRFYFYNGESGGTADIYVITPNAGTTWDMTLMSVAGVTPPVAGMVLTKFKYLSRFKACVLVVGGALIHFFRTQ